MNDHFRIKTRESCSSGYNAHRMNHGSCVTSARSSSVAVRCLLTVSTGERIIRFELDPAAGGGRIVLRRVHPSI